MNELSQVIGRFHPLLVHLPIGILLLAVLFEWMGRRSRRWQALRPAAPVTLLLGALAAVIACLTGWLLSLRGEYEEGLLVRHQWAGIGVAIVSLSAYWLRSSAWRAAYHYVMLLLLPGILIAGHWGIVMTHGEGYWSTGGGGMEAGEGGVAAFRDIPNATVSQPSWEAVKLLQMMDAAVLPTGKEQPFVSVNFVNVEQITPDLLQALYALRENIAWLNLSGLTLHDSLLVVVSACENLTRLHLDHTNIADSSLAHLQNLNRLAYLNLVGTPVTAEGVSVLSRLPNLRQLFLYQTKVIPGDTAFLTARFPRVRIEMGGYQVPILPTDTTFLSDKK
ncbi:MAG: hypothetical protein KIS77_05965 [Saprospiraceae bacterium]|nr:hypothetical protein [Saprospiraceae bacterium]